MRISFRVIAALMIPASLHGQTWRSSLYPENWQPPSPTASFYNDKIIQDFSYAGYKRGEDSIPNVDGPVFDVTAYGADPSGTTDSSLAIQSAINACASAGGGVVYLPAGEFRVAPQDGRNYCVKISKSNIVLRGAGTAQTFLLNTSHKMRSKSVIQVAPDSTQLGTIHNITADLPGPTRRIPVDNADAFAPGDTVRLEWSFTDEWTIENSQQSFWNNTKGFPYSARYIREVVSTNPEEGWIGIDVPTRYSMKMRDASCVRKINGLLTHVGIESLAIGNLQHPGNGWAENDYNDASKAGYDTHGSHLIQIRNVRDSWIGNVRSRQPAANTSTCHMLSNGIYITGSTRVTVQDCEMRRPQYGGGGGNGYMYIVQSNDSLFKNCLADFSRHGFSVSLASASGNVFHRCEDRETKRATGSTGSYTTNGEGSDNHMHFSHSNLWDQCHAHNSYWDAKHRTNWGNVPHGLTSGQAVFWNITGSGTRFTNIVNSEQLRHGYVIGTSGSKSGASNPISNGTSPADHLEGIGSGATLHPPSLYLDQLSRRLVPRLILTGTSIRLPENTFTIDATLSLDDPGFDPSVLQWQVASAPPGASITSVATATGRSYSIDLPGTYMIEASGIHADQEISQTLEIEVLPAFATPPFAIATADFTGLSFSGTSVPISPAPGVNGFHWSILGGTTLSTPDVAMISGSGKALKATISNNWSGIVGAIAEPATLAIGETLKLSLIGQYTEAVANNANGLRIGFTNSSAFDNSYGMQVGTGGNDALVLSQDNAASGDNSPGTGTLTTIPRTAPSPAFTGLTTAAFTASFAITRSDSTTFTLTGSVNGSEFSGTNTSSLTTFNAIYIRHGNVDADFQVDNVVVELIPAPPSPYTNWATINAPGSQPDEDFDADGVPNAIEFVLGGDKDTNDRDKLPTAATVGTDMIFNFVRDRASIHQDVIVTIEVGTNLTTWSDVFNVGAYTATSTPGVTVTDNGDGTDTVSLVVPMGTDIKKFARFKVSH